MITDREVVAQLAELSRKFDRVEKVIDLLLVRRIRRDDQAKIAGVTRQTLLRREKRLQLQRLANG